MKRRLPGCGECPAMPYPDEVVIHENGHSGYKCEECNLIYVSPQPDLCDVVNLYDHDSAYIEARDWISSSQSFGRQLKSRHTLRLIRKHVSSGDLLEIGPGGGAFLRQAAKFFRVHAAEYNPQQVQYILSLGYECRQGAFSEVYDGDLFDVIYLCDVLSHLRDPIADFRAMHRMLRPGGIIVIETGNFGDMNPRYYRLIERWQYPDHLFFFSRRSLDNLASAADLEVKARLEYSRTIEFQLGRLFRPFRNKLQRSAEVSSKSTPSDAAPKERLKNGAVYAIRSVKHTLDFIVVYCLGRFLPKQARPQTLIMVLKPR